MFFHKPQFITVLIYFIKINKFWSISKEIVLLRHSSGQFYQIHNLIPLLHQLFKTKTSSKFFIKKECEKSWGRSCAKLIYEIIREKERGLDWLRKKKGFWASLKIQRNFNEMQNRSAFPLQHILKLQLNEQSTRLRTAHQTINLP